MTTRSLPSAEFQKMLAPKPRWKGFVELARECGAIVRLLVAGKPKATKRQELIQEALHLLYAGNNPTERAHTDAQLEKLVEVLRVTVSRPANGAGRPRELPVEDLPVYPSMQAMSGATGIPLDVLKSAKRDGCPAFHQSSRVALDVFLRWYYNRGMNGEADEEDVDRYIWEARLVKGQALAVERKNREAERMLVPWSEVEAYFEKHLLPIREKLLALPTTLDVRCNPDHPELARMTLNSWTTETLSQCRLNGKQN